MSALDRLTDSATTGATSGASTTDRAVLAVPGTVPCGAFATDAPVGALTTADDVSVDADALTAGGTGVWRGNRIGVITTTPPVSRSARKKRLSIT